LITWYAGDHWRSILDPTSDSNLLKTLDKLNLIEFEQKERERKKK
jgi:hypothetical protein